MYYFIIPGYNWIVPGKPGGTEARCDTILTLIRTNHFPKDACHIILTAGKPAGSNRVLSLAEEMADYISYTSKMLYNPTPTPLGWSTLAEIQGAILRISSISSLYSHTSVKPQVYICTNRGHMIRVQLYWWALAPKDWQVTFVPAKNQSFTKMEWLQEAGKVMQDIYRIATGKIKRTAT